AQVSREHDPVPGAARRGRVEAHRGQSEGSLFAFREAQDLLTPGEAFQSTRGESGEDVELGGVPGPETDPLPRPSPQSLAEDPVGEHDPPEAVDHEQAIDLVVRRYAWISVCAAHPRQQARELDRLD